ncbi:MAG: type IV toxin-antitoxin system AbiEi family antitoxin domain-containing protein [bacterium]
MKKQGVLDLFRLKNTVFTFKDISLILTETNKEKLRAKINYFVKKGDLYRIRKGIYSKDKNYDKLELAAKIYTPSYISLETVLFKEGVVFQYYRDIFVLTYLSRKIECDGQSYNYKKIKGKVLTNSLGIEEKNNYYIASKERAFLDILYFNKNYHFDNLKSIDWNKCFEIIKIYENHTMEKKLKFYYAGQKHS